MPIDAKFLEPYTNADIVNMHGVMLRMIEFGITPDDVVEYIDNHVASAVTLAKKNNIKINANAEKSKGLICPKCKNRIMAMPVNQTKCTQVGGGFKTMDVCKNTNCNYTLLK